MVCILQVIGPSGSGKTTVIVEVSKRLKTMGFNVLVLKHTHHNIDIPGKDSWRFLEEGGADYAIVFKGSGERIATFTKDKSLEELIKEATNKVDVILVEGFKDLKIGHRIELTKGEDTTRIVEEAINHLVKCLENKPRENLNTPT
jgi:molybdopterin-guanine dinucleotide biosynthesis protein B